jgi:hypothetical protein
VLATRPAVAEAVTRRERFAVATVADAGPSPTSTLRPPSPLKVFAKSVEGDVEAHVTAKTKAVGDSFRWRRDRYGHPFDLTPLHAVFACRSVSAHDLECRRVELWRARSGVDHDPHRMGSFGREAVNLKRAEQADRRVRYAFGDFRERVELAYGSVGKAVETATHVLKEAPLRQSLEVRTRNLRRIKISGANRALSSEAQELGGLGGHDTKRCMLRLYINVS